jgi:clumping factor A
VSEERDPTKLADEMDKQARDMEERSDELGGDVADVRQDWQQKQGAADVPGANPPDLGADDSEDADDGESAEEQASHESSPAPEAPPEEEGPSSAEMASEGQAGPPADSDADSDSDTDSGSDSDDSDGE